MAAKKLKGGENSKVDTLVNQLFNKTEGGKGKRPKGGDAITPFLSALALLGTRIANDKRFFNSKFKLDASGMKKKSPKRRYKPEVTGGNQSTETISNMMSSLSALSGNVPQNMLNNADTTPQSQAVSALTGGRRVRRVKNVRNVRRVRRVRRSGGGEGEETQESDPAASVLKPVTEAPKTDADNADAAHDEVEQAGGKKRSSRAKRRAPSPKRRSPSPKKRASPKKTNRKS